MGLFRHILLWGSENDWMRKNVPNFTFVKRAVKRFMPGEKVFDAIEITKKMNAEGIPTTFTYLGENLTDLSEARKVTNHYLQVLDLISEENIKTEISVKLTQIGFDLSREETVNNFREIAVKARAFNSTLFIDMEGSKYTSATIEFYKEIKKEFDNVGLCIQAYLFRTEKDLENMLELKPVLRIVKGAYNEPDDIAFESKEEVDKNYLNLSYKMLDEVKKGNMRAAFATHDEILIEKIKQYGESLGINRGNIEFQMLYGIKPLYQKKVAMEGFKMIVLISYGEAWFPWYMRRLAERPANVGFVIKNLFAK